jgi:hypothetical protein
VAILSVVESCRRQKISVRDYLAAILPGLADVTIQQLSELTPNAWDLLAGDACPPVRRRSE